MRAYWSLLLLPGTHGRSHMQTTKMAERRRRGGYRKYIHNSKLSIIVEKLKWMELVTYGVKIFLALMDSSLKLQLWSCCKHFSEMSVFSVSGQLAPKTIRPGRLAPESTNFTMFLLFVFYRGFLRTIQYCMFLLFLTNVSPLCWN